MNTVALNVELLITDGLLGMEIPEDISNDIENYETIDDKMKQSKFWITYSLLGKGCIS